MFLELFLILINLFSNIYSPVKATTTKAINLLSKPKFIKTQKYQWENKKNLNSSKKSLQKINKSVLLWDIPLRSHVSRSYDRGLDEHLRKKVLSFIFKQSIKTDLELQAAVNYIKKPFFTRSLKKIFKNPYNLNLNKAKAIILQVEKRIEYDLDSYLSYFSKSLVKQERYRFPHYQKFIDLESSLIKNYGLAVINFINYHYSSYPHYHDA